MSPLKQDRDVDMGWDAECTLPVRQNMSQTPNWAMQVPQNISAPRQSTPQSYAKDKHRAQTHLADRYVGQPDHGTGAQNKMELMRELSAQMNSLRQEKAQYAQKIHDLESHIGRSELAYGEMLQEYLRLGRAIELQKKHIKEDKMKLAQQQGLKESTNERLDATLTRISSLVQGSGDMIERK